MEIKIEKNIPIPGKATDTMTGALRLLDVGDSFVVPVDRRNACCLASRSIGIKVKTKNQGDGLMRVWRVQ